MLQNQLAAHEGDVIGRGDVPLRRQPRGVEKAGVRHAQLLGAVIHLLHEQLRDARHFLRQRHGGVVAAGNAHGFQKLLHGDLLPFGQIHLAAAHGRGVGADGDHVLVVQLSPLDGLHGQQQGHDLGDAGRLQLLVLVLREKHLSRFLLHEQRGLGLHRQLHGVGRQRQAHEQRQKQRRDPLFHASPSPKIAGLFYA